MIDQDKKSGGEIARELRELLKQCDVTLLKACSRANLSPSTFYRWEKGSEPGDEKIVDRFRLAVLEIAAKLGSLPIELTDTLSQLRQRVKPAPAARKNAAGSLRALRARVDKIEQAMTEQLGATL